MIKSKKDLKNKYPLLYSISKGKIVLDGQHRSMVEIEYPNNISKEKAITLMDIYSVWRHDFNNNKVYATFKDDEFICIQKMPISVN